jgi:hypothetical protein
MPALVLKVKVARAGEGTQYLKDLRLNTCRVHTTKVHTYNVYGSIYIGLLGVKIHLR